MSITRAPRCARSDQAVNPAGWLPALTGFDLALQSSHRFLQNQAGGRANPAGFDQAVTARTFCRRVADTPAPAIRARSARKGPPWREPALPEEGGWGIGAKGLLGACCWP